MADQQNSPHDGEDNPTGSQNGINVNPLENWHTIAYDEYKNTLYTLRNRQLEIIKTYLWIGSALLTFELFFANELADGTKIKIISCTPDALYYILEIGAIFAASASFFISIWLMKGRKSDGTLYPFGFGDGEHAVQYMQNIHVEKYIADNVSSLHDAICTERSNITAIGKNLRLTCRLLLFSFSFQASAVLWMSVRTIYFKHFA